MSRFTVAAALVVALGSGAQTSQQHPQQMVGTGGSASASVMITPDEANWSSAPDAFPAGAQMSVLEGNPMGNGSFTVRLKVPDGYRIPPHWHPTDENVTVISGTMLMGMGDRFNEDGMKTMPVGSFAKMPQHSTHYVMAKGDAVVQVHGQGPFQITYVNPSDDPRKAKH